MRHEAISRSFEMGIDMMHMTVFFGHRDLEMLRRYTYPNAERILQMVATKRATLPMAHRARLVNAVVG